MNQPFVMQGVKQLGGFIGGMIIHHYDIVFEVSFLAQSTVDGIENGLLAIEYRNHHRGLDVEVLLVEIRTTIERRIDLGTNLSQMGSGSILHFDLHLTVPRIHIVELLHARDPQISLFLSI